MLYGTMECQHSTTEIGNFGEPTELSEPLSLRVTRSMRKV